MDPKIVRLISIKRLITGCASIAGALLIVMFYGANKDFISRDTFAYLALAFIIFLVCGVWTLRDGWMGLKRPRR